MPIGCSQQDLQPALQEKHDCVGLVHRNVNVIVNIKMQVQAVTQCMSSFVCLVHRCLMRRCVRTLGSSTFCGCTQDAVEYIAGWQTRGEGI